MVEGHTDIDLWLESGPDGLGEAIVALSALLPSSADPRWNEFERFESGYNRMMILGGPRFSAMLEQTDDEFAEFAPLLKITAPKRSLLDYHDQMAAASS